MHAKTDFIPAAHWQFLTPYYHGFMKLVFGKRYQKIADLIQLQPGDKVLDVGCGPGEILRLLCLKYPDHEFTGLDMDPEILAIARKNLPSAVNLTQGSADALPFLAGQFEVITSSLMIHHLTPEQKQKMMWEVYRVLKPGGRFYLFDFAPPTSWCGKIFTTIFRKAEQLDDALTGKYRIFLEEAGFKNIQSLYKTHGMFELLLAQKSI